MDRAVQVSQLTAASYRGGLLRVSRVVKRTGAARHVDGFNGDGDSVARLAERLAGHAVHGALLDTSVAQRVRSLSIGKRPASTSGR